MAKRPLIPVTASSGNVFADIGVAEPEEELARAQLASRIREIVRSSRITQVAAAAVMGIDQPKVSALLVAPGHIRREAARLAPLGTRRNAANTTSSGDIGGATCPKCSHPGHRNISAAPVQLVAGVLHQRHRSLGMADLSTLLTAPFVRP
jgi:predicted XRE-type DNA-binding protein